MSELTQEQLQQVAFTTAVRGLASQGWERSMNELYGCRYRGSDGRKCAVGWLLDDETAAWGDGPGTLAGIRKRLGWRCSLKFFVDLRDAHDFGSTPADMQENLRNLAQQYNLTWPPDVAATHTPEANDA